MHNSQIQDFPYTNNARLKTRYLVIRLFLETKNRTKVAKKTGVSRRLVNEWVTAYLSDGLSSLNIKKQLDNFTIKASETVGRTTESV